MDLGFYNSYLEVDMGIIARSFDRVKQHIEPHLGIIPVIKGNAYGIGTEKIAEFLLPRCRDMMACAQVLEADSIRRSGTDCEILILGGIPAHALHKAVELGLQVPVFNPEGAVALSETAKKLGKRAKAHIKIETGLGRIGAKPGEELMELINTLSQLDNVDTDGVFTHFATATVVQSEYTLHQLDLFRQAMAQVRQSGIEPKFVHCRNTGAASWLREDLSTHIRAATLLFGYPGMDDGSNLLSLGKEPLSWRAFVTNVTTLHKGESCGYGRAFVADRPTKVAIIDVGYGDGLFRPLVTQNGPVLVGDHRAKYLCCSMDQAFIDVTDIPVEIGDEVTIFGYSRGGAPLELAELELVAGHTMTYLQSLLTPRVKRIYINEEDI